MHLDTPKEGLSIKNAGIQAYMDTLPQNSYSLTSSCNQNLKVIPSDQKAPINQSPLTVTSNTLTLITTRHVNDKEK